MPEIIKPYTVLLNFETGEIKSFKKKSEIKLSKLRDFFFDREAVDKILSTGKDPVIYEYFEHSQPEVEGHLNFGVTIVHPGLIGKEYHLTRGHYHTKENAAEIYIGLIGKGVMIMQTKDQQVTHLPIRHGNIIYVPPFWAHRTVNVSEEDLAFLYVYPSDAGHNYDIIKQKGFAKLVVNENGEPKIIDSTVFSKEFRKSENK